MVGSYWLVKSICVTRGLHIWMVILGYHGYCLTTDHFLTSLRHTVHCHGLVNNTKPLIGWTLPSSPLSCFLSQGPPSHFSSRAYYPVDIFIKMWKFKSLKKKKDWFSITHKSATLAGKENEDREIAFATMDEIKIRMHFCICTMREGALQTCEHICNISINWNIWVHQPKERVLP